MDESEKLIYTRSTRFSLGLDGTKECIFSFSSLTCVFLTYLFTFIRILGLSKVDSVSLAVCALSFPWPFGQEKTARRGVREQSILLALHCQDRGPSAHTLRAPGCANHLRGDWPGFLLDLSAVLSGLSRSASHPISGSFVAQNSS